MSTILTIYKCSQHAEADFSYFYPTIDTLLSCETASTQVCKDLFLYDYTTFANIQKKKSFKLLASHMQMSCNTEHNLRHSPGHPQDSELQRNHIELIIELWFL